MPTSVPEISEKNFFYKVNFACNNSAISVFGGSIAAYSDQISGTTSLLDHEDLIRNINAECIATFAELGFSVTTHENGSISQLTWKDYEKTADLIERSTANLVELLPAQKDVLRKILDLTSTSLSEGFFNEEQTQQVSLAVKRISAVAANYKNGEDLGFDNFERLNEACNEGLLNVYVRNRNIFFAREGIGVDFRGRNPEEYKFIWQRLIDDLILCQQLAPEAKITNEFYGRIAKLALNSLVDLQTYSYGNEQAVKIEELTDYVNPVTHALSRLGYMPSWSKIKTQVQLNAIHQASNGIDYWISNQTRVLDLRKNEVEYPREPNYSNDDDVSQSNDKLNIKEINFDHPDQAARKSIVEDTYNADHSNPTSLSPDYYFAIIEISYHIRNMWKDFARKYKGVFEEMGVKIELGGDPKKQISTLHDLDDSIINGDRLVPVKVSVANPDQFHSFVEELRQFDLKDKDYAALHKLCMLFSAGIAKGVIYDSPANVFQPFLNFINSREGDHTYSRPLQTFASLSADYLPTFYKLAQCGNYIHDLPTGYIIQQGPLHWMTGRRLPEIITQWERTYQFVEGLFLAQSDNLQISRAAEELADICEAVSIGLTDTRSDSSLLSAEDNGTLVKKLGEYEGLFRDIVRLSG